MGSAFYISKLTETISYIMFITKTGIGKGDTNRGGGGGGWGGAALLAKITSFLHL